MKILLTLFVLFFSFSVVADEDLIGVKLLCKVDPENVENYAFNFIDRDEVKIYISYPDNSIGEVVLKFISHPKTLKIYLNIKNNHKKFMINRQTLEIGVNIPSTSIITYGVCNIIKGDDYELFKSMDELMTI